MSHSAIVHDGIFGFGDERQNNLVEKEFEDAAAKGFRPCTLTHHPPSPSYPLFRADMRTHRSGVQEDERHQPERHFPFRCLRADT
jgi:hypothetical protein